MERKGCSCMYVVAWGDYLLKVTKCTFAARRHFHFSGQTMTFVKSMSYMFGKVIVQCSFWDIFKCILRGVWFLLANCSKLRLCHIQIAFLFWMSCSWNCHMIKSSSRFLEPKYISLLGFQITISKLMWIRHNEFWLDASQRCKTQNTKLKLKDHWYIQ